MRGEIQGDNSASNERERERRRCGLQKTPAGKRGFAFGWDREGLDIGFGSGMVLYRLRRRACDYDWKR